MYVVMGATGNTGQIVAQNLLNAGKPVRVLGRDASRLATLDAAGAEPFVCDVHDGIALANAFTGATAVYAMIPPNPKSENFRAEQDEISNAIANAVEQAKVTHVVTLSSVGADKESSTGPVVGLHQLEQSLNRIASLNVLHLRAAYFMENTLAQVGIIQGMGLTAGPLKGDLKLPMIATKDVGDRAAAELLKLEFTHHQTHELLGQRDLSMDEAAKIIGEAIGRPDLKYVYLENAQIRPGLLRIGLSGNMADLLLEMSAALNSRHMLALEPRSVDNTTPTSFETFASEVFAPLFRGKSTTA